MGAGWQGETLRAGPARRPPEESGVGEQQGSGRRHSWRPASLTVDPRGFAPPATAGTAGTAAGAARVREARRASAEAAAAAATAARVRGLLTPPTRSGAGGRPSRAEARARRGRNSMPPPGRGTAAASAVVSSNDRRGRRGDGGRGGGSSPSRARSRRFSRPPAVATAGVHGGATRARPGPLRRGGVDAAPSP